MPRDDDAMIRGEDSFIGGILKTSRATGEKGDDDEGDEEGGRSAGGDSDKNKEKSK